MRYLSAIFVLVFASAFGQQISGIQLFNPKTNDETPVIEMGGQLILRFDDLAGSSQPYRYTIRHLDRNWADDGLFFTEFATGNLNALIDNFKFSFNTLQKYTHYTLAFPNGQIQPKISGNFEIVVYKDSQSKPLFVRRFSIYENNAQLALRVSRFSDARSPDLNQRVEVQATGNGGDFAPNINSMTLSVMQNNNPNESISNLKPSSSTGNQVLFQQTALAFAGNNEFYYFDNKNLGQAFDMVAGAENKDGQNFTYLHPVWAFPLDYHYQPDVNGAFYFRRNDLGIERDPDTEADYSWVYFSLDSEKTDKEIYVLGGFNGYIPTRENQMSYDATSKKYVAKIYLKQGFYNYMLATKNPGGTLNFGEINGNFWQTENLYQAFLYYTPFGGNYDGLMGYGEYRTPVK